MYLGLKEPDEEEDLDKTIEGDLGERSDPVRAVGKGEPSGRGQHARKTEVLLHDVTQDSKHGDAPVLDFHIPEAVETLLPERVIIVHVMDEIS